MGTFDTGGEYVPSNPQLVRILEEAARRSPYNVVAFSGERASGRGSSQHAGGDAVDIVLIDPQTGAEIPNYKAGGEPFRIYEEFARTARAVQQETAPGANNFRWGGYFRQGETDLMHFDLNSPNGMVYGSWEGGLNEAGRTHVAGLGAGQIYSPAGIVDADAGATYQNLWGTPPMAFAGGQPPNPAAAMTGAGIRDDGRPIPTLREGAGSRSNPNGDVRALQEFLADQGYDVGAGADGIFGPNTAAAVRAFQQDHDLTVDGVVGQGTWGAVAGISTAGGAEPQRAVGPVHAFLLRTFGVGDNATLSERVQVAAREVQRGVDPLQAVHTARYGPPPVPLPQANPRVAGALGVDNPAPATGAVPLPRPDPRTAPKPVTDLGLPYNPYDEPGLMPAQSAQYAGEKGLVTPSVEAPPQPLLQGGQVRQQQMENFDARFGQPPPPPRVQPTADQLSLPPPQSSTWPVAEPGGPKTVTPIEGIPPPQNADFWLRNGMSPIWMNQGMHFRDMSADQMSTTPLDQITAPPTGEPPRMVTAVDVDPNDFFGKPQLGPISVSDYVPANKPDTPSSKLMAVQPIAGPAPTAPSSAAPVNKPTAAAPAAPRPVPTAASTSTPVNKPTPAAAPATAAKTPAAPTLTAAEIAILKRLAA